MTNIERKRKQRSKESSRRSTTDRKKRSRTSKVAPPNDRVHALPAAAYALSARATHPQTGQAVSCNRCTTPLFHGEVNRCCRSGRARTMPDVSPAMTQFLKKTQVSKLGLHVNDGCAFTKRVASSEAKGTHQPASQPCLRRLEGSIVHFQQPPTEEAATEADQANNPRLGPVAAYSRSWWHTTRGEVPVHIEDDLRALIDEVRARLAEF